MAIYQVELEDGSVYEVETDDPNSADKILPNKEKVQQDISERKNPIDSLREEVNTPYSGNLLQRAIKAGITGLKTIGTAWTLGEAAIANPAMEMQKGNFNPNDLGTEFIKGATGQKVGELGDLIRTTGVGGEANEPLSKIIGLFGSLGIADIATKGKLVSEVNKTKSVTIKPLKDITTRTISKTRDYAANKVNAIRGAFWDEYAPKEWEKYGQAIENLAKEGSGEIDGVSFVLNLEKKLAERGLISPEGDILKAFNTADTKLLKSYEAVKAKLKLNPKATLTTRELVDEYKNLRGQFAKKPTALQRNNIQAANDFFNSAADQINSESFAKAKIDYRSFKENQQMIDEAIGLYEPSMKTAKGEKWLMEGGTGFTTQGRKTAKMITEKTGQTLKGSKLKTGLLRVNPLQYIKR